MNESEIIKKKSTFSTYSQVNMKLLNNGTKTAAQIRRHSVMTKLFKVALHYSETMLKILF